MIYLYKHMFVSKGEKEMTTALIEIYAASVAGGDGIVTGISAWFPPVAAIAGVQTGYWSLVAARVNANNKGKGVYVGVTWVAVFNIKPL